jgi:ribose/xylose/arabinose/galactoside ABC-type transport system permease subunit
MAELRHSLPGIGTGLRTLIRSLRVSSQAYGALSGLIVLILFDCFFTPNFLSAETLNINLTQVTPTAIVATGMTLVIATGGIDLSVGSLMAIAGALAPLIFGSSLPLLSVPWLGASLAIVLSLLLTGTFGLFNGVLVTRFRIQPIIATLVLFIAGRGLAEAFTNGNLQVFSNATFQFLGLGRVLGIPFQVILMLLIVAAVAWIMRSTAFGHYVLATGGNEEAAQLAGVPVRRIKLMVYMISGLLAGLAGLIVIAINSSSDATNVGLNEELNAIAAVAVGGTPLTGGRASVVGTLIGALIIQLIRFSLLARNVPPADAQIINAFIITVAVYLQRSRGR